MTKNIAASDSDDKPLNDALDRDTHGLHGLVKASRLDKIKVTNFPQQPAETTGLDVREIPATRESVSEAMPRTEGQAVTNVSQVRQAAAQASKAFTAGIEWTPPPPITQGEWTSAKLTAPTLVERYLYADLALLVAAGGTGKTTLALWEAVHIALGRPLYGRKVHQGRVLFLTGEDSRERLTARLREVCKSMGLQEEDVAQVREYVRISDVTGRQFKFAANVSGDITLTPNVDRLAEALREDPPALIVIDPYVSFGPGEASVNDGAQGMVLAARRLTRALGSCVRFIHHVGQDAARSALKDQYTGRGGTALPDGSRMVAVLSPVEDHEIAPASLRPLLKDGGQLLELCMPKLSYCPSQAPILIARNQWKIAWAEKPSNDQVKSDRAKSDEQAALRFISDSLERGQKHTKASAKEQYRLSGLPRDRLSAAIGRLIADGRLQQRDLPEHERHGSRKQYLVPIDEASK